MTQTIQLTNFHAALTKLVSRIKTEIVVDVQRGDVPDTVKSFSELHNYVDANAYGCFWASDKELDSIAVMINGYDADGNFTDELMLLINGAQNVVNAWLQMGGLHARLAAAAA
jgi:predicted aconitase